MTDLGSLGLASSSFASEGAVASLISALSLLVSLLGYLRIRSVGKAIRRDRELIESFLDLPEIHYHLEKASDFLALSRSPETNQRSAQEALRDGINLARFLIHSLERLYSGSRTEGNPYVVTGSRCQERGSIDLAMYWYKRALRRADALGLPLSHEETRRCLVQLQTCHFLRYELQEAANIARLAKKLGVPGCRTESEIATRGWLYCTFAWLGFRIRRLRHLGWKRYPGFPVQITKD